MNRKTLVLPAVIGLLAPVLAACGGSDDGGRAGGAITVGTTDSYTASKEAPAPLDPAYAYDAGSWNLLRQTLQTLMTMPRGGGEPVPEAAKECGFTDSGNERYECTLRDGLKFASGDAITATDVKYSIDRVLGIKASTGVSGLLSTVDTIETQGYKKVIFHLRTPDATFPYKLATPVAGIVHPEEYPRDKLRTGFKVDGSGPYTLRAEVKGDTIAKAVFTKNDRYTGQLTPKNNSIELRPFADADAMGAALDKGDIDLMTRTMTPAQVKKLSSATTGDVKLTATPGLEIRYLGFNTEAPVVRDKAVRQAMAQIIDRGQLASTVYGEMAEPLFSLVPANITGHSNAFFNKYGAPSADKARQILSKAGVTTPVRLTLNYTTDHYGSGTKKEFEVLKTQLDRSGLFKVEIKGTKWTDFRADGLDGKYAVYGLGWFPDFPDADNFLAPFLDEGNFLALPYVNSAIRDDLIPQSRREADRLIASDSIEEIQNIVAEDVPVLPLWQGKQYVAARDDIQGVEWALDSSSNLQLWELSRGVSG
ncbi:ABC transporter substrate-binding protein [Streptomyces uncialis]|uniref:ABC transporter substrate-binding protein n=1 Tax=Streptomyces uncialis TaxID=1048205 RepID=UPI00386AC5D4|nr:ABC transporter substrate-binding protein [Streptomyces uncialis]